jgi:hypothetical protein
LREAFLGRERARLARLEREVQLLRRDPSPPVISPEVLLETLRQMAQSHPQEVATVLESVRARGDETAVARVRQPRRSPRRWSVTVVAAATVLLAAARGDLHDDPAPRAPVKDGESARRLDPGAVVEARPPNVREARAPSVVLEETELGFGLGESARTDDELRIEVRDRLASLPELAGTRVRLSVRDGWVWLRGEATPDAREAATAALDDLGAGVLVVNQLVVPAPADMLAGR